MEKNIIVSGGSFTDIDSLACAIVYDEFLNINNNPTQINLNKNLNESITPTIRDWIERIKLKSEKIEESDKIIVVDISDPENICPDINQRNINELFDHHFGYEAYWSERIGNRSHIENVGACATLIYERIKDKINEISEVSINLLLTAIISNTLNLKAQITNNRDIMALKELRGLSKLPDNWPQIYYDELNANIFKNPVNAIMNDLKIINIKGVNYAISQIELWNSKPFLLKNLQIIRECLKSRNIDHWFYTSPSIEEGKNYFYTENLEDKKLLHKILNTEFTENIGKTNVLWLRKEIIREMQKNIP